jgi:hypothetical protein
LLLRPSGASSRMRNIPLGPKLSGFFMREMVGSLIRSTMSPRDSGDFHIVSKVYGTRAVARSVKPQ